MTSEQMEYYTSIEAENAALREMIVPVNANAHKLALVRVAQLERAHTRARTP